ncbi:aldo/keto reductase [Oricola thermophila]
MSGAVSLNYGEVDDAAALAGLRVADEMGARVFDTAAAYGGGHSEWLLGQAFGGRDDLVIVTKFGHRVDPGTRQFLDERLTPALIRETVDQSRLNLQRDRLDLVLFHVNDFDPAEAGFVFDTLDELRDAGIIGAYGWSTDHVESARAFAGRDGFVAIENDHNIFDRAEPLMAFAKEAGLISLNRLPLAMGLLTGKYRGGKAVGPGDLRAEKLDWMKYFRNGRATPEFATRLEAIRDLLCTGGRSLAQGALGWILAKAPHAIPVPGFKSETQVRDNLGTLEKGPLPDAIMAEIDAVLDA